MQQIIHTVCKSWCFLRAFFFFALICFCFYFVRICPWFWGLSHTSSLQPVTSFFLNICVFIRQEEASVISPQIPLSFVTSLTFSATLFLQIPLCLLDESKIVNDEIPQRIFCSVADMVLMGEFHSAFVSADVPETLKLPLLSGSWSQSPRFLSFGYPAPWEVQTMAFHCCWMQTDIVCW